MRRRRRGTNERPALRCRSANSSAPGLKDEGKRLAKGSAMAYNDFTLEALKQQFGLRTDEEHDYFAPVEPVPPQAVRATAALAQARISRELMPHVYSIPRAKRPKLRSFSTHP